MDVGSWSRNDIWGCLGVLDAMMELRCELFFHMVYTAREAVKIYCDAIKSCQYLCHLPFSMRTLTLKLPNRAYQHCHIAQSSEYLINDPLVIP